MVKPHSEILAAKSLQTYAKSFGSV